MIEMTGSRNAKKELLEKQKDNEFLKKFLVYTYDTSKMYGLGAKSLAKLKDYKPAPQFRLFEQKVLLPKLEKRDFVFDNLFDLLDELIKHPYGSAQDVEMALNFLIKQDNEERYWYTKCMLKDLKIGVTAISINEVFSNLIPIFEVQKGEAYDPTKHKLSGTMWQCEQKMDGYRMMAELTTNGVKLFTDSGSQFVGFSDLENELMSFRNVVDKDVVLDGELLHKDGTFNSTQKVAFRHGPKDNVDFWIFDIVPKSVFEDVETDGNLTCFERSNIMRATLSHMEHVNCLKSTHIFGFSDNEDEIKVWLKQCLDKGYEGMMIKQDVPFVRKRHKGWLKLKRKEYVDVVVVDMEEGTGKNRGKLGALIVDYKGFSVNVGGGFTDEERKDFWKKPNLILDKVIEVSYTNETHNEQGGLSLRHPNFERIREDKINVAITDGECKEG